MRLYTNLSEREIYDALDNAKASGKVTSDVRFMADFARRNSKYAGYRYSYEIQLGTWEKNSLPKGYKDQHGHTMNVRRYKNTGDRGASSYESIWAATWHEWGWFILEVFKLEPTACFGGPGSASCYGSYRGLADFHTKTEHKFDEPVAFAYAPSHP